MNFSQHLVFLAELAKVVGTFFTQVVVAEVERLHRSVELEHAAKFGAAVVVDVVVSQV